MDHPPSDRHGRHLVSTRTTNRVPEQQSGPGPFVPFQTWPEVGDIPNWRDVSPRLGVAYDLFGTGKTALKASINRYLVRDNTQFAITNNPLLFNATATRTWTDANRDFIPQESELGPLSNRNFGTAAATTVVDDAIRDGLGRETCQLGVLHRSSARNHVAAVHPDRVLPPVVQQLLRHRTTGR